MNRQAWRDFFITVFLLGVAFVIALLSSVAAEQSYTRLAAIAAGVSLILALLGALYIIPRLARNIRLEFLKFAIRTSVTLEGLIFIVFLLIIGFASYNTGNNLMYLVLSAMLAFLIAANLIARITLADMSVQLRFPDHVFAGDAASITITLTNHKRFMPSYSLVIEALSEHEEAEKGRGEEREKGRKGERESNVQDSVRVGNKSPDRSLPPAPRLPHSHAPFLRESGLGKLAYFVLAPARASVRQKIEHTFNLRGRYPITGFRLATKFPAGFFKKWRRIDAKGEIIVYPKPKPLDDFYHALPMLAGQVESPMRGSGDDLYAIRRYHPSDHMRNIDWKATAKSMTIMVREHTREDERRLTIVFDTSVPAAVLSAQSEAGESVEPNLKEEFQDKFERAIVMAASLANHFVMERSDVELVTSDERYNVRSGSGYEHLYKILRSLSTLQPTVPADDEQPEEKSKRPWWSFITRKRREVEERQANDAPPTAKKINGGIAWRLIDEMPMLADDRRFKVLITSAAKGTIPAHVWRSAHVVFMDDL